MLSSWKICCTRVQQRWVFAVMGCLATTNAFTMRICLSLAITEMVTSTETSSNYTSSAEACPAATESTSSSSSSGGTYDWDEYTQGIILSSFFWGFLISPVPGGLLAEKFGGKHVLGLSIFSTSIFTLLTPIVVRVYDSTGLIVLRVLIGLAEGMTNPALSVLIAQWAPPLERSKITAMVMTGTAVGTVLGNSLSGVLIQNFSTGWPTAFYFFGGLGVLWFLAWVILCYNNPDVHPFISDHEKNYLHERTKEHTQRHSPPTPWRHMMASVPVWALLATRICYAWGYHTVSTDLPKYMANVLKFKIQTNGLLSALPYALMWLVGNGSSWLADWFIKSGKLSRTNVRKVFQTACSMGPAVFIIAASYSGCDRVLVVVLFTLGVGMMGFSYSSLLVTPNDLSPNHSGTLMALSTAIGSLAAIGALYTAGVLTPNQDLLEWRTVFWITTALFTAASLIFIVWGDGDVQHWNGIGCSDDQRNQVEKKGQADEDLSTISK